VTPYSLKYLQVNALDLTMTNEKDAYKQFGTVWMLACIGNLPHYAAGVVLCVLLGGVSSVLP